MPKQWNTPGGDALNLYTDILKQPHTLIAGTTGSGKSVVINGIIYTALYKAPTQARFILIDPKMLELWMYKDLPHTLKYCDTTADTLETLEEAAAEMMREYSRIRAAGLKQSDHAHTYILIDELGDLLTEAPQITHTLARLAKLGRAANIHIIAATQNPNRKTLSAEFSANCPARLGLRCENPIESRQIIHTLGELFLHKVKFFGCNNRRMTVFHIVLLHFSLINFGLFREKIHSKSFLKKCVTLNAAQCGRMYSGHIL